MDARSRDLRRQIVRVLERSRRGHVGSAFSLVEILRVLYDEVLRYNPAHPSWDERDRFILSKGHGCLALYVLLAEKGFFVEDELWQFCQSDGLLGGHPEHKVPGVEVSTGSLGHGLSLGVGMALALRKRQSVARVVVLVGDGESNEGSVWEGALCASKHRLTNLTVLVDANGDQSYGPTSEVLPMEPLVAKWNAFGFCAISMDGHDVDALSDQLARIPFHHTKPGALICRTVKGKGVPEIERNMRWHHKHHVTDAEIQMLQLALE